MIAAAALRAIAITPLGRLALRYLWAKGSYARAVRLALKLLWTRVDVGLFPRHAHKRALAAADRIIERHRTHP